MDEKEEIALLAQIAATIYAGILADPKMETAPEVRAKCVKDAKDILRRVREL